MLDKFKEMVTSGSAIDIVKDALSTAPAIEKAEQMLRAFNETIPTLKALGLAVSDMSFKMGIPPEIAATLVGAVEALDPVTIKDVKERHRDNQVVAMILEALILAANFKSQLSGLGFAGIKVDVRLGIFPSVQVGLLTAVGVARGRLAAA